MQRLPAYATDIARQLEQWTCGIAFSALGERDASPMQTIVGSGLLIRFLSY
jgi:hypothetical protein